MGGAESEQGVDLGFQAGVADRGSPHQEVAVLVRFRPSLRRGGSAAPVRLMASIDMGPVLDAADVQHPGVLKCAERDAIVATARHAPSFELKL